MLVRHRYKNTFSFLVTVIIVCSGALIAAQERELDLAETFLQDFCLDCHSGDGAEGERDLDLLDLTAHDLDTQIRLQEVIDQLNLQTMPPKDGDQPAIEQRKLAIDALSQVLNAMRQRSTSTDRRTVIRRLSTREYRNTLSDLLAIDMTMFDPTIDFPSEETADSFDNIGDALRTSGFLLENFLKAAELSVEKAMRVTEKPNQQSWRFEDDFYQQAELATGHRRAFENRFICLYDHPFNDKIEGGYGPISNFKGGVPVDGIYEVRVFAKAMHRDSPYSSRSLRLDLDEPFRLGIRAGDTKISDMVHRQPIQPLLAEQVVRDEEFQWYHFRVRLDAGFAPRFTFENGHHDFRGMIGRLYRNDREKLPEAIRGKKGIFEQRIALIRSAQIPHIRIDQVEIEGPVDFEWPSLSRQKLIQADVLEGSAVPKHLRRFVNLAYRRPATDKEVAELVAFYQSRREIGESVEQAFKNALKLALCSPEFLYFHESDQCASSEFALAERMSYFLTSSMPDDRLRTLASEGKLSDNDVLRAEVKRLLRSDASARFVHDFLDSWLGLRDLGTMPPDTKDFWFYYAANLEQDMKTETQLVFRHLIQQNAPAMELISGRYSFLNRDLAKLYGVAEAVSPDKANEFRRVAYKDPLRGGLLGQSSVLTVSANGIDTSPVIRGVWMLEKIFGTPTPPPPDDVPAIDPDTRGASTIRQQLVQHRLSETCNHCHRKIDPLGFALECFDAIGQYRTHYGKSKKTTIDTSGDLPGSQSFRDLAELKQLLVDREEFFVRTLVESLVTHALGRRVEPADRFQVDQILHSVKGDGYRVSALIEAIVLSDLFRS